MHGILPWLKLIVLTNTNSKMMKAILFLCIGALAISAIFAEEAYQKTARDKHNVYRTKHRVAPLGQDDTLNKNAVACAQYYAQQGKIDHSCPYKNGAGENLVGGAGSWTPDQFATMGTDMWYNEVNSYDYNNPGFSPATGHFTQVVWKGSSKFGFGVVNTNGFTAGVGLYSPPGNYLGQFPENVLKP